MPAIFPRWTNNVPIVIGLLAPLVGAGLIFAVWYWFSPYYTDVGYRPEQPVPYSHKLHAGEMGIDCRYCHNTVEKAAHAAIPPTGTCMNCHELVKADSPRLALVRESHAADMPVPWVRVHQLPDYAFFNHSPHLAAGVGCVSCHGRVDQMAVVEMKQPLSMGWCLDCHRDPKPNLRPLDQVTNMNWDPAETPYDPDRDANRKRKVNPPTHCSGCHR
ncbi:MAG: cytochrome c family protein [Nannocystaceae bacterium]|nr:cytochrome c family protein [Nannocystaceae bacterium]